MCELAIEDVRRVHEPGVKGDTVRLDRPSTTGRERSFSLNAIVNLRSLITSSPKRKAPAWPRHPRARLWSESMRAQCPVQPTKLAELTAVFEGHPGIPDASLAANQRIVTVR